MPSTAFRYFDDLDSCRRPGAVRRALGLGLAALMGLAAAAGAQERRILEPLIADARGGSTDWRYTTEDPGDGWAGPDYDDSSWPQGPGGFGAGEVAGARVVTAWTTSDIRLRREFDHDPMRHEEILLSLHHDDDVTLYLNGREIFAEAGFTTGYTEFFLPEAGKEVLKAGRNVLAVHCRNTGSGPQYVDVGVSGSRTALVAVLAADARVQPGLWRHTTADPGLDWHLEGYDDAAWGEGPAGFGSTETYADKVGTAWVERDIWLRKSFLADREYPEYLLTFHHDDDLEIYVNGEGVTVQSGFSADYQEMILPASALKVRAGMNLIAVRCTNSGTGPQFVDVGILGLSPKGVPTRLAGPRIPSRAGARSRLLTASGGRLDLGSLSGGRPGRLELHRPDGTRAAVIDVAAGSSSVSLPSSLGAGLHRFRFMGAGIRAEGGLLHLR